MKPFISCLLLSVISYSLCSQDLVVAQVEGPTTYDQYEEITDATTTITVRNAGIVNILNGMDIKNGIYLSTDDVMSDDDYLVGNARSYFYGAGQTESTTCEECRITAPPGNYFLIIRLDTTNQVTETDEGNNVYVAPGYVVKAPAVDWRMTYLSVSNLTPGAYDQVTVSYEFENFGTTNTGGYIGVTFYLSTDPSQSSNDITLGIFNFSLERDDFFAKVNELTIPGTTYQGQYYIIAKIDQRGIYTDFNETDETNNLSVPISIAVRPPDIDLEIVSIEGTTNSEYRVTSSITIRNNGTTGIDGFYIRGYFTSLPSTTPTGLHVSPRHIPEYLGPHESVTLQFDAGYDYMGIPPGTYYLILNINPEGIAPFIESNTANNFIVSSTMVINVFPQNKPSLAITNASFKKDVYHNADRHFDLAVELTNTSQGVNIWGYDFNITIKDDNDKVYYTGSRYFYQELPKDKSYTEIWPLSLEAPLPEGQYHVSIDCIGTLCGGDPHYNLSLNIISPVVSISGTIRGEDGTPIDKGKLFLYQKMDDGRVKFIDKKEITTGNSFSFPVDSRPHTLYFIPDPVSFAGYVPTIFDKTVTLKPGSFISTTENRTVILEVLKLDPLATGKMTVTGNVNTGAAQRTSAIAREAGEDAGNYPVVLLSESGEAVALAMTDANGNYEFHNLPAARYKVVVAFELDQAIMQDPLPVDVTTHDAKADIAITPQGTLNTIAKSTERISLNAPVIKTFGDQPVNISATSTSGLPVTFTSANPAVAEVINGKMVIKGAGTVTITATTNGNNQFWPGTTWQSLTVNKRHQYITFGGIPALTVHDKNYSLPATASSTLPLTVTSDNEQVATVDGMELIITGPGVANITVAQDGNNNFNAALPVTRQLVVNVVMGIEETAAGFRPYPNPTTGLVYLPFKDAVQKIEVADALGKVHDSISWTNEQIDIGNLNAGVYFIRVQHASASSVFRIVKE